MTNSEDTSISDSLSSASVSSIKLTELNVSQCTNRKKSLSSSFGQVEERNPSTISLPFSTISGEKVGHVGQTTEGSLILTNYRLFIQMRNNNYNIPLGLVDQVECREIFFLHINCKDARYIRCTFPNNETASEVGRRIQQAISTVKPIEEYFAFTFYERLEAELSEDMKLQLGSELPPFPTPKERFDAEIKRMEFNVKSTWRISDENKDYELCGSYPTHIIVPYSIDKKKLDQVAQFRSARRFPAVVWRHRGNGAVICRCSQPEVGWFGWRSTEDEELVQNIIQSCAFDKSPNSGESHSHTMESLSASDSAHSMPHANGSLLSMEVVADIKKLLILDARSYTTAVANRARGGGCECLEYYPNCEIQFMNLANIHSIRKSFINVRQLCALPSDQANWYSQLENCKWLQHMSGLMKASLTVVTAIENDGRPVMVHCSDGWDRTPQIVSLAEILLDPYYRSMEGFQVLVEREWFDFGHKFGDRCGQGIGSDDGNERCPVFLQWLDCLHQLLRQFPTAFQFNLSFLLKLVQHTYSNLFGTFLCNSAKERELHTISSKTLSVWRYLRAEANADKFRNSLYANCDKVLWPSCEVRDLVLFSQVYLGYENPPQLLTEAINPSQESSPAPSVAADGETTERLASCRETLKPARSYENLASQNHTKGLQRKLSDSSLADSFYGTQELEDDTPVANNVHSRTPSAGTPATPCCEDIDGTVNLNGVGKQDRQDTGLPGGCRRTFDVDGLAVFHDEVQSRLNYITSGFRSRIDILERELQVTKLALLKQVGHRCTHRSVDRPDDIVSNADSLCSGEHHSVGSHSSELSWEAIDEKDTMPTRWVPDYAAHECMNCDVSFWFGFRKHHCRSCGKVFCADCSEKSIPLPNEQIFSPVRVCKICFAKHSQQQNMTNNVDALPSAVVANGISSHKASNDGRLDFTPSYTVPCNNTSSDNSQNYPTASVPIPTHCKIKKHVKSNGVEYNGN